VEDERRKNQDLQRPTETTEDKPTALLGLFRDLGG
jgi:hypothetical protein